MNSFVRNLITEWRRLKLSSGGETVVIAVSGGADSLALMLAWRSYSRQGKLDIRLVAAHFNHQLRGEEADADEQFIRTLASEHRIRACDRPRRGAARRES